MATRIAYRLCVILVNAETWRARTPTTNEERLRMMARPGSLPMSDELKIRWGDLGPPAWPCEVDFYGRRVIVTARDIEVAQGDPDAVFTLRRSPLMSDERYTLGAVVFPFPGD